MRVGFYNGDPIRYTLLGDDGKITSVVYPFDAEKNYLVVRVTKSDDPSIPVGSTQHISPEGYKHIEYLPYDACELYPTEHSEFNMYTSFLERRAKEDSHRYMIDQDLINGDKQLFMKLVKEGE